MEIYVKISLIFIFFLFSDFQSWFYHRPIRWFYQYRSFKHSKW